MKAFLLGVAALICASIVSACAGGPSSMVPTLPGSLAPTASNLQVTSDDVASCTCGSHSFVSRHAAADREKPLGRT